VQEEDGHVWKKAKTKRSIVPPNWQVPIKQRLTNLFDRETWRALSEVETNSKPQPVPTTKNVEVPFFEELHEKASLTLCDFFEENQARRKRDVRNRNGRMCKLQMISTHSIVFLCD